VGGQMDLKGVVFIIFSLALITTFLPLLSDMPPFLEREKIALMFAAFLGIMLVKIWGD
jgi:hypothetical protein